MRHISYFLILLLFFNCNTNSKDSLKYSVKTGESANPQENIGKIYMETNCYVCHSPTASHDNRLAPPMEAIKRHYINENTSKEEFVEDIQNWIKNPNLDDAKMYGAVKRFGVMPKTPYPEETIRLIAEYMYDNDIEKPEWFNEHHKNKKRVGM